MKLQSGQKLVVASHNKGKVREINELINPYGLNAVSAGELGLPEPIEDGDSFAANAIIKAEAAADAAGIPALADDSGLEVDALNGAPGVYSARYAGEPSDSAKNNELLLKNLEGHSNRKAQFRTVITLIQNGEVKQFEGAVSGQIIEKNKGLKGFGYDPIFVPDGHKITFAEMSPEEKNAISHRGKAVAKLVEFLKS